MDIIILEKEGPLATRELWLKKAPQDLVYAGEIPLNSRHLTPDPLGFKLDGDLFLKKDEGVFFDALSLSVLKEHLKPQDMKIDPCPLWQRFDLREKKFTRKYIAIPLYLRHVIQAIVNIYPLDPYLAAHYERQMLNIAVNIRDNTADLLNYLNLIQDFDLPEESGSHDFLRFQRKLYLTYQHHD